MAPHYASMGCLNIDSSDRSLDEAHNPELIFLSPYSDVIDFIPGELCGQDLRMFLPAVSPESSLHRLPEQAQ